MGVEDPGLRRADDESSLGAGESGGVLRRSEGPVDRVDERPLLPHDRAVERVADNERRLRALLTFATEAFAIVDEVGVVRFISPTSESVFGYAPNDLVGNWVLPHVHPEDRDRVRAAVREVVTSPRAQVVTVEYRFNHRTAGWRTVSSTVRNLLEHTDVRGVLVVTRDVTEWRELQGRLHMAQKVEAVGRLAGGVAHDFNNLLTVVTGNAQLLLQDARLADDVREQLREIEEAANRAATVTQQLLAFSRQQVLQPTVLRVGDVLDGLGNLLTRLLGEAIMLHVDADPECSSVRADRGQLEQVLLNLAVNARDAMPDGGSLRVEARDIDVGEAFAAAHPPMTAGRWVLLRVVDSGMGMDEATRRRVFEPFFTTKEQGKGSGLGLSTVYGIVKQSGGFIWVQSARGVGTAFSIYLPPAPDTVSTGTPGERQPLRPGGDRTILVVEDEEMVRRMAERTLRRAGYQVRVAANGQEAIRICRESTDPIDLLLTDVVMPGMNGRELARLLRQERPDLLVLLMSGYTHLQLQLEREAGEISFLQKPFTVDQLLARVREAVGPAPAPR
jgi:PAS domain S-box-containing protein